MLSFLCVMMTERIDTIKSVELCTESFGRPEDPCILLIMGATASMVWWDAEFCAALAARGRFVIRYDQRDTGRSTSYPPGAATYSVLDLMDDALGALDLYQIGAAHWAGMSLGGMLAQLAALRAPERVKSLTLIGARVWDDRPDLPDIDPHILEYHAAAGDLDWADRDAVVRYLVGSWKTLCGSGRRFDAARAMELARLDLERARSPLSRFNHAALQGGEEYYGRAGEIRTPALIIHGSEDPVSPFPHALAIRDAIPGSQLLALEGAGHELHRDDWPRIIDAIVEHTSDQRRVVQ